MADIRGSIPRIYLAVGKWLALSSGTRGMKWRLLMNAILARVMRGADLPFSRPPCLQAAGSQRALYLRVV